MSSLEKEPEGYRLKSFTIEVKRDLVGRRIDSYLTSRLRQYSRSFIQRHVKAGKVQVAGRPVKASYEIKRGDRITLELLEPVGPKVKPQDIPLDIIYEDDNLLVVNKSGDMVVHPARGQPARHPIRALGALLAESPVGLR